MSEFRKNEITRCLNQFRDGLTVLRASVDRKDVEDHRYIMTITSMLAATIDLVGGIAADMNAIREMMEYRETNSTPPEDRVKRAG